MDRKDFLIKAAIATVFAKTLITSSGRAMPVNPVDIPAADPDNLPSVNPVLAKDFLQLLQWMKKNGWADLVKKISGIDLNTNDPKHPDLFRAFSPQLNAVPGCDDFAGKSLIQPGFPALSLLYHLLASPRVIFGSGESDDFYPSLEQLDTLENYIYSLYEIKQGQLDSDTMVLCMFAYEYRPACKTPHQFHADLVFSRTGFSRIGNQPMAPYDKRNRCFSNKPSTGSEKEIAVTPARYGLFLAERLSYNKVSIKQPVISDNDGTYDFLLPVRKIFKEDLYLNGYDLFFSESHVNEKLRRLCQSDEHDLQLPPHVKFDLSRPPFTRKSCSSTNRRKPVSSLMNDKNLVALTATGSSVLLSSVHAPLVKRATQVCGGKEERLRIKIPALEEGGILMRYSNRRYTSFKVLSKDKQNTDGWDIFREKVFYPGRSITNYNAHRNAPMFVNIREVVSENDGNSLRYLNAEDINLQKEINKSYWAGLFEDNICDGCVTADIVKNATGVNPAFEIITDKLLRLSRLPAFSVVTAPDFFPMIESFELKQYKDLFLVGGVEDMGGARKRANPAILLPDSSSTAFPSQGRTVTEEKVDETVLAIISHLHYGGVMRNDDVRIAQADALTRSNYLPDSATKIFYPGWDITYSGGFDKDKKQQDTFFTTYGLGSPFIEDSKLCAAVNGMWAGASPDSARTYRGSLTVIPQVLRKSVHPPTAVPLLDNELGLHSSSPAVLHYYQSASTGWDGEQGPFIIKKGKKIFVHFTEIGRADYVQNVLNGLFDMSSLRKITTAEIKFRMLCLKKCYERIHMRHTDLWLVGAEKVENWANGANGYCIPRDLYQNNNQWCTQSRLNDASPGYLYLFAKTIYTPSLITGTKRMEQSCDELYIFQVSRQKIAHCHLRAYGEWIPKWK